MIAKRGDEAPGSQLPNGTSDLIFNALSAPAVTANGRRAAFVASLTSGINNTENRKTIWFADLQEDGYHDLKQAAATGMPVQGLSAEDEGKVLNLGTISPFDLDNTRNLPPIALDPEGRNVAFIARLNTQETVGKGSSGDPAVFIASDSGIRLVAKENEEFTVTISSDFGSSDESFVLRRFFALQYINSRMVFLAGSQFTGIGVFEYAGGSLNPLFLSPGFNPNAYMDPTQGEIRVSSIGSLGLNSNGALAYLISGTTKINAEINGSRFVDALRYRPSVGQNFVSVAKSWDSLPGDPTHFISGFSDYSLNEGKDILVSARLGVFDGDTPIYPTDQFAILHYDADALELEPNLIAVTGDVAEGLPFDGDRGIINRLEAVETASDYTTYSAYYPGTEGSFLPQYALYRTNLREASPSEPVFYVDGLANVNGVGTVTGILNYLLGPRGDQLKLQDLTRLMLKFQEIY